MEIPLIVAQSVPLGNSKEIQYFDQQNSKIFNVVARQTSPYKIPLTKKLREDLESLGVNLGIIFASTATRAPDFNIGFNNSQCKAGKLTPVLSSYFMFGCNEYGRNEMTPFTIPKAQTPDYDYRNFTALWRNTSAEISSSVILSLTLLFNPIDGPDPTIPDHLVFTKKMLSDEILADVTIIACNGSEIKCHRSVLASHSPVFKTMFESDMVEARTGIVEMKEWSEESVRAFLEYLYMWKTQGAEESPSVCIDLLDAGNKYDVKPLAQCMEQILLNKTEDWFTGATLLQLIIYLSNRELETLKVRVRQLFESKYGDLNKLAAFQKLYVEHTETVTQVLECFSTDAETCKN